MYMYYTGSVGQQGIARERENSCNYTVTFVQVHQGQYKTTVLAKRGERRDYLSLL